MKLEEFQRISKNVKTVISKFRENPGKFAAIVLKMYWNMKAERDTLIDDIAVLRANNKRLERENEQLKKQEKVNRTKASLITQIDRLKQDYKNKIDDMKELADENEKLRKEIADREQSHIDLYCDNKQLKRKAQAYDKMMTGEMGELYKKAEAWDRMYDMLIDEDMTVREFDGEIYDLLKQTGKTPEMIINYPNIDMEAE